ncbi:MAG: S1C family serine protease [Rhodothermaceae bacterium]
MKPVKTIIISSSITLVLVTIAFSFLYLDFTKKLSNNSEIIGGSAENSSVEQNIKPVDFQNKEIANQSINQSRNTVITKTVSQVSPAVVGINVTEIREYRDPWSRNPFWRHYFGDRVYQQPVKSLGSGVIISPDGYIITNDHVAGKAVEVIVTLTDGSRYDAKIIGTDEASDLCVLKIEGENLPYVKFAEDQSLLIGEWVIALGNPFGLFAINDKPTVTVGVISSMGMNIGAVDNRYYLDMIQTDASINGGNSGGPLVNSIGELIGINTIIYSPSQVSGSVGVGFAIPIWRVQKIVNEIIDNGNVDRNYWTGLNVQNITNQIASAFELDKARGVIVSYIQPGSPAEKAGIKPYDVICKFGKYVVNDRNVLVGALADYRPEDDIEINIIRNKKNITKKLKLERKK